MRIPRVCIGGLAGAGALVLAVTPAAQAEDLIVESFDGTPIITHFYPANGIQPGQQRPTILIGHGWGGTGEGPEGSPRPYLAAGYNVLTWDARGFGGSGGTAMIDHPEFEARDASALIDYVAGRPEARLDKPGDPRLGMAGGSYGGGIQFITAARDKRVDVITPAIAWHNLLESLYPRASVKAGWDLALIGAGVPPSIALGVFSPAGIQTGNQSEHFYNSIAQGAASGQIPEEEIPWFEEHGPDFLLKRIKIPALIAQGTVDTLFNLDQGHRNYRGLARNGAPLKMIWFCGGHGICTAGAGQPGHLAARQFAWMERYLKRKRKAKTGPAFEWIDQNGTWHTSGAYPLKRTGELTGTAATGTIPLVPGYTPTAGNVIAASPDPAAPVKVAIPAKGGEDVVGSPKVSFTYSATGSGTRTDGLTHIFGRIVDQDRNVVAGNQDTPIPIALDGESHTVSTTLTRIASIGTPAGYELQIGGQSNLFDGQRASGLVSIENLTVSLPSTAPRKRARSKRGGCRAAVIRGTRGADSLRGTRRADNLIGRSGNDLVSGLRGRDCLRGGPGRDLVRGGPGRDKIRVRDGERDIAACGRGRDQVLADRHDVIRRSCERIRPRRLGKPRT